MQTRYCLRMLECLTTRFASSSNPCTPVVRVFYRTWGQLHLDKLSYRYMYPVLQFSM